MSDGERYTDTRRSPRVEAPGELMILVESFGQFLEQHAKDISEGGMFLRSQAPPPPGTRIRFAIRLADGYPLIQGEGEVVWRREQRAGPFDPPGMGVRFVRLDEQGRELVRRLVEERRRAIRGAGEEASAPPEGRKASGAPAAAPMSAEARQALDELLDVLEEGTGEKAAPPSELDEPFGPLEPAGAPPSPTAGADLFQVPAETASEPRTDAGHGEKAAEPSPQVPPSRVVAGAQAPPGPEGLLEAAGDSAPQARPHVEMPPEAAPAGAAEDTAGETAPPGEASQLPSAELPEIGRPAGYYDGEEPLPPAHSRLFWPLALPVALLALAGLLYGAWQLGYLSWAGLPSPGGARARPAAGRVTSPQVTPVPGGTAAAPAAAAARHGKGDRTAVPASPAPATAAVQTAVAPSPTATAAPRPTATPNPRPAEAPPATAVRRITWRPAGPGVEVRIVADGRLDPSRTRLVRLEDPPRVLLRIRGIRSPYEPTRIPVGEGGLEGLRIWLHDELRPPQLYVVFDLTSSGARLSSRPTGTGMVITIR